MSTVSLSEVRERALAPVESKLPMVKAGFFDLQSFELMQRIAKAFSASTLVPKDYQGNLANCMIALNLAQRTGSDPLMTMQNLVIVHGRPTWSAQYLIATANTCGRFTALRFEFFGEPGTDSYGCRAAAIEKETNERLVGADVTVAMAKREGWYGRNGSKWQSMPQQMLMYRAGSWWVRAYAPELSMGLMTQDEAAEVYEASRGPDGVFTVMPELTPAASAEPAPPAPQAEQKPAAAPQAAEWPRQVPGPDGEMVWTDSAGELFDNARHGWSTENARPSVTASGEFRARRGAANGNGQKPAAAPAPAPAQQTHAPAQDEPPPSVPGDEWTME